MADCFNVSELQREALSNDHYSKCSGRKQFHCEIEYEREAHVNGVIMDLISSIHSACKYIIEGFICKSNGLLIIYFHLRANFVLFKMINLLDDYNKTF